MKHKDNNKLTFGIIGYGRFGSLWATHLSTLGTVFVFDTKNKVTDKTPHIISASLQETVAADIVFLAVPMSELQHCCEQISSLLSPQTLVVDVCSIKTWTITIMKKCLPKKQPILGTHPLFGPDAAKMNGGIQGLKIVVCPTKREGVFGKKLLEIFKKLQLNIITATARQHDQQMANSQALMHFIGRSLANLKLGQQDISTPSYDNLVRMCQTVNNDTLQLFFDMQTKNPFASVIRDKFVHDVGALNESIMLQDDTLQGLRSHIEKIDRTIIRLLSTRMKIVKKIGVLKQTQGIAVVDPNREAQLKDLHREYSEHDKIDYEFISNIFNVVINHARAAQHKNI